MVGASHAAASLFRRLHNKTPDSARDGNTYLLLSRIEIFSIGTGDDGRVVHFDSMRQTSLKLLIIALTVAVGVPASARTIGPLPIWPNGAPGEHGPSVPEKDTTTSKDGLIAGKRLIRLGNVTDPTITVYQPPAQKNTGTAVLVFPGGAYRILAMDLEGTEVCAWLNSIGVTGVLLKYRVPSKDGAPKYAAALEDAQRALGIVRLHAKEWQISPERIGVLGFSAGGHLAAALSNNFEKRTYKPIDAADAVNCRPDFAVLIYAAYLAAENGKGSLSPELTVRAKTPPTFLVQTEDDPVHVENSLYYYLALKNSHVPAEMHLYSAGGHGYGLRRTDAPVTRWPELATEWLHSLGLLRAPRT